MADQPHISTLTETALGDKVRAVKTVNVPESLESATIMFSYNVLAPRTAESSPRNLLLRIEANGDVILDFSLLFKEHVIIEDGINRRSL
ncbi:MAG: hypothetical protein QXL85_08575 [Candidatus Bathyarchaeia archaeon]